MDMDWEMLDEGNAAAKRSKKSNTFPRAHQQLQQQQQIWMQQPATTVLQPQQFNQPQQFHQQQQYHQHQQVPAYSYGPTPVEKDGSTAGETPPPTGIGHFPAYIGFQVQ